MIPISALKPGQKGIIQEFPEDEVPIKLLEIGCLPGNTVELVQIAPLNDPLYINVDGCHVAIRRAIASQILISLAEDPKDL